MFNLFKKKDNIKKSEKYKNIYELATKSCNEFEKNNDYTKFTKETINIIENKIEDLSKQGVRRLQYSSKEFHIHTDMDQVREYFKQQGFKIHKFIYIDSQFGIFTPKKCLSADIRW